MNNKTRPINLKRHTKICALPMRVYIFIECVYSSPHIIQTTIFFHPCAFNLRDQLYGMEIYKAKKNIKFLVLLLLFTFLCFFILIILGILDERESLLLLGLLVSLTRAVYTPI